MNYLLVGFTVVTSVVTTACGGGDSASDAQVAGTPDASITPDAAIPDGDVVPDASPAAREGRVNVAEERGASDAFGYLSVTMMLEGPVFGATTAVVEPCRFIAVQDQNRVSAGVVTVDGTLAGIELFATPNQDTPPVHYKDSGGEPDLFAEGATLTITAAGGTVPAFAGSVVAPTPLDGVVLPETVSRSVPLELTWTAGDADEVEFSALGLGGPSTGFLLCSGPDTGAMTIPAAAIDLFPELTWVALTLARANRRQITAGDWNVTLAVSDRISTNEVEITD